jgi:hypothetical protein
MSNVHNGFTDPQYTTKDELRAMLEDAVRNTPPGRSPVSVTKVPDKKRTIPTRARRPTKPSA